MALLRIANRGEDSSLSPLQHALAERLPCRRCLLLFHTLSLFFRRFLFPSSMSFYLICGRRQLPWSVLGIIKVTFIHSRFLQSKHELMGIFQDKKHPILKSSPLRCFSTNISPTAGRDADRSGVLALRFLLLFSFK